MQHLIPVIDARPTLMFAQKRNRVPERTDDTAVAQVKHWLNEKLTWVQHGRITTSKARMFPRRRDSKVAR
jgi:hypothetical protein